MAFELKQSAHVATTWSALIGCGVALWWGFGFSAQVEGNTGAIKAVKIRGISQEIRYVETEQKKMLLYESENGKSVLSQQILADFAKDVEKLKVEKECLRKGVPDNLCHE
jgi:hypothetical protein